MLKYGDVLSVSIMSSKNGITRNIGDRKESNNYTPTITTSNSSTSNSTTFKSITTNLINTTTLGITNSNQNQYNIEPITTYNTYEKKYITQASIQNGPGTVSYNFKNIINLNEQITLTGKVITRDAANNSASFLISAYTKYLNNSDPNNLNFTITVLYSSDPVNWTIKSMSINSNDLVLEITSNQNTTTNWIISLESISV